MRRDVEYKGIMFHIGNFTPRNNEYERGLKYRLFVGPEMIPTDHVFMTIREAKTFIEKNYWLWL